MALITQQMSVHPSAACAVIQREPLCTHFTDGCLRDAQVQVMGPTSCKIATAELQIHPGSVDDHPCLTGFAVERLE